MTRRGVTILKFWANCLLPGRLQRGSFFPRLSQNTRRMGVAQTLGPYFPKLSTLPRCFQQPQVQCLAQAPDLVPDVNRYESVSVSPPEVASVSRCLSSRCIVGFRFGRVSLLFDSCDHTEVHRLHRACPSWTQESAMVHDSNVSVVLSCSRDPIRAGATTSASRVPLAHRPPVNSLLPVLA